MKLSTAAAIVGVAPGASEDEIEAAYAAELARRRDAGDSVRVLDDAREMLIDALPPPPPPPPPVQPQAVVVSGWRGPTLWAVGMMLATPILLLSGIGQALGVEIAGTVFALGMLCLLIALFYHRAIRRRDRVRMPIGGLALGAAAVGTVLSLNVAVADQLTLMLMASLPGLVAIGSAASALTRRTSPRSVL